MSELIRNARLGWLDYTENGKMVALFLLALVIFWFGRREKWEKYHALFKCCTFIAVCCICPITAVLLMLYQTKFYDYRWIWNLVPITLVISLALTLLWSEIKEKKGKRIILTLSILGILYCSGSMGYKVWDAGQENVQQKKTSEILAVITDNGTQNDIILWAPQGIMTYARALNGEICLPYGRNMWDPALNAYSYDTYGEQEQELYQWMCQVEETGEGDVECMKIASELGVNHILLPGNMNEELLQQIEEYWGIEAAMAGECYWIYTGEN